jgi:hypothetical protein
METKQVSLKDFITAINNDYRVNWEDEELICDNCYKKIESAYGDD